MARTNQIPTDQLRACWLLIVDRHHFGNRAHVDMTDLVIGDGEADKDRLSLSKKLLDCAEVKAIVALFRDCAEWLFTNGLPSFIRPGMYRIPPGMIPVLSGVTSLMTEPKTIVSRHTVAGPRML